MGEGRLGSKEKSQDEEVLYLPQGYNNEQERHVFIETSGLVGKSITDKIKLLQCTKFYAEEMVQEARQGYAQETPWMLRC